MKRIFDFATLRQRNTRRNNNGETAQPRSTVKKLISTALAVLLMTLSGSSLFALDIHFAKSGGIYTFNAKTYGDGVGNAMVIPIKNTGTSPIAKIIVTLTGAEGILEITAGSTIVNLAGNNAEANVNVSAIAGFPAGTHVATLKAVIEGVDGEITQKITLPVNQFDLGSVSAVVVDNKEYDGSTTAKVTEVTFTNTPVGELVLGTDYEVTGAAFASADAATTASLGAGSVTILNENYILGSVTTATIVGATGASATISKATTFEVDIFMDPITVEYDGQAKSIIRADVLNARKTDYRNNNKLNITNVSFRNGAPTEGGTYEIIGTVLSNTNFARMNNVVVAKYIIEGRLTKADFNYFPEETLATYDGKSHASSTSAIVPKVADVGDITLKYVGVNVSYDSKDAPTNAGTYNIVADVAASVTYNAQRVVISTLEIRKAQATLAQLTIPGSEALYNGALYYIYSDKVSDFPFPVPASDDIAAGLGSFGSLKYNGNTNLPATPGQYAVTIDIDEGPNYLGVENLLLGYLIISDAVTPVIVREVTVIGSEYFACDRTGSFIVNSGGNLTLTLTPVKPLPEGQELKVSTNRHIIADDEGGLTVTANPDGTYTVFIPQIKEAVEVTISTVATTIGTGSEVVSDATRVWSSGGQLIIAAGSDSGQASIYAVSGALVKTVAYAAGETVRTTLPTGIYVAVAGNRVFKVVINN